MEKSIKKPLIISLAINGREDYVSKQKGLIDTLHIAGDCDHWILNEYPKGVTPHSVTPYLFKFDLLSQAINKGYEKVFWMDSTMRILKNPFELLEKTESGIVAFHNLGHPVRFWITDLAVENLKCEECLNEIESTWGGCIGFDFTKKTALGILGDLLYHGFMGTLNEGGSTRPEFKAARHDQSCLSVLLYKQKIPLLPYGIIAAKKDVTSETVIQYGS